MPPFERQRDDDPGTLVRDARELTLGEDDAQGLLVNAYCSNTRLSTCLCRGRGWNDLWAGVHRFTGRNLASPLRRAITFSGE